MCHIAKNFECERGSQVDSVAILAQASLRSTLHISAALALRASTREGSGMVILDIDTGLLVQRDEQVDQEKTNRIDENAQWKQAIASCGPVSEVLIVKTTFLHWKEEAPQVAARSASCPPLKGSYTDSAISDPYEQEKAKAPNDEFGERAAVSVSAVREDLPWRGMAGKTKKPGVPPASSRRLGLWHRAAQRLASRREVYVRAGRLLRHCFELRGPY